MIPHLANKTNKGLTLLEVLVVIIILTTLIVLLLPKLNNVTHVPRIACVNNLKQIGLAYHIWEGDNNNKFPMMVSVTNGGTMELLGTDPQFVRDTFLVMSNILNTPKLLHCPADEENEMANTFSPAFSRTNISYFIGVDATDSQPQSILSGDDNFSVNGSFVKSGLLDLSTNSTVAWTKTRHHNCGNFGLADGSAIQVNDLGLQPAFQQTGFATNQLAFP